MGTGTGTGKGLGRGSGRGRGRGRGRGKGRGIGAGIGKLQSETVMERNPMMQQVFKEQTVEEEAQVMDVP